VDACVVGDTCYLLRSMQPGPFSSIPPIPSAGAAFAACQRFAACAGFESSLPNIPLLRYLYSLATPLITHSLCPKGKGQATLHAICCAASATTGSRPGCLFSSWKGMPRLQCMEPGTYTYWDLLVAVVS